ncbi:MAG: hypothetical protein QOG31_1249 [Thermoplasmata archaeon]|jgi:hypothetical protein|nr:hypothetical protein [Thermoplasmata archaeon]
MRTTLPLSLAAALLLMALPVAADPPGTCVGGYNPDALSNVCYSTGPGNTLHTGSVGSTPAPVVCLIGNLCTPGASVPTYDPNGGTAIPIPGVPLPTYVEVLGIVIVPPPTVVSPCGDGGVQVGGKVCIQSCDYGNGVQVGNLCVSPNVASCTDENGNVGVHVGNRCTMVTCTDAYGYQGVRVGSTCYTLSPF